MGSPLQHLLRMHFRSVGGGYRHGGKPRASAPCGGVTGRRARSEGALVAAGRDHEGAEVPVVDCDGIGGACVLWDCVPSKTFIASTGVRTELRRAAGLGFDIAIEDAKISLEQIH